MRRHVVAAILRLARCGAAHHDNGARQAILGAPELISRAIRPTLAPRRADLRLGRSQAGSIGATQDAYFSQWPRTNELTRIRSCFARTQFDGGRPTLPRGASRDGTREWGHQRDCTSGHCRRPRPPRLNLEQQRRASQPPTFRKTR
jgi:hypothetical protein